MLFASRRTLAAAVATLSLGVTASWAANPAQQEARLRELEGKIATLEAQQATSSKDLAATVDAVLRDAERRSQLLANGGDMGAGYENGFYIRSGDGWMLKPGAQFQFRHVTNFREDVQADGDNDVEDGFEVRRMRFDLGGTAVTKDLQYFFQWESPRNDGDMALLEAWARYMCTDQWGFWLGQIKSPVTHEFFTSTKTQLAADTSLMDSLIGGGVANYTQGALLVYGNYAKDNPLNVLAGFTDGANQINTDFTDHTYDYGLVARAEYKLMGDWQAYRDFTAKGTKNDLLVLGAAANLNQSGDAEQIIATTDLQYENAAGFGAYGAAVLNHQEEEFNGLAQNTTDWGFLAQASYLFTGNWELFARYDATLLDNNLALRRAGQLTGNTEDLFHEVTVGVNYYLGQDGSAGHRAKFTVDLNYLPNGSPRAFTGLGILDDNGGNEEWILRAQFQLLI